MGLVARICQYFADRMAREIIWDRGEGDRVYISRHYTTDTKEQASWFLHNIRLPDNDPYPHNHPYEWQLSLILASSYTEEVTHLDGTITLHKRRWFNWISGDTYHRILELHGDVWTIFMHGPKHGLSWGFLVPGRGHVHNEKLADVKADMDRQYWADLMAHTVYKELQ